MIQAESFVFPLIPNAPVIGGVQQVNFYNPSELADNAVFGFWAPPLNVTITGVQYSIVDVPSPSADFDVEVDGVVVSSFSVSAEFEAVTLSPFEVLQGHEVRIRVNAAGATQPGGNISVNLLFENTASWYLPTSLDQINAIAPTTAGTGIRWSGTAWVGSLFGWGDIDGKPTTFAPSAHAASHKFGGSDLIGTATPTANAIPMADGGGKLDVGWLPTSSGSSAGAIVCASAADMAGGTALTAATPSALPFIVAEPVTGLDKAIATKGWIGAGSTFGTGVAGNIRGKGSIDLSMFRSVADRVASGHGAVLIALEGKASGANAGVFAGTVLVASGQSAVAVGGSTNTASGVASAAIGGSSNTVAGEASVILGGSGNTAPATNAAVIVCVDASASGGRSAVVASEQSSASGVSSAVIAADDSGVTEAQSAIVGGSGHTIGGTSSVVLGGGNATVSSSNSAAIAAFDTTMPSGDGSAVIASSADVTGSNSAVIASTGVTVNGNKSAAVSVTDSSIVGGVFAAVGSGISATAAGFVTGQSAVLDRAGARVHSPAAITGRISQMVEICFSALTTDSSAVALTGTSGVNGIAVRANSCITGDVYVNARTDGGNVAAYRITFAAKRGTSSASILASENTVFVDEIGASCTLTALSGQLAIMVAGAASDNTIWSAKATCIEVS